ncbi:MAG: Clp1/GlmU family protein, partial [Elusimicrobiota bacterium]
MVGNILPEGIYLISGDAVLSLIRGKTLVIGKELEKGERLSIPAGKTIPVEVEKGAEVSFESSDLSRIQKLPERTIPGQWDKLVDRVAKEKAGTVLVLGEVDTGKTFFSTYIANRLIYKGVKVSVLDLDVGQSDIGPPGTLGLALLEKPQVFLTGIEPKEIYYVGSHSPGLHFLPTVVGFHKLTRRALSLSDVVIIDTPGWVQGDGGRALRRAEIELLTPDIIVLMQRTDELE